MDADSSRPWMLRTVTRWLNISVCLGIELFSPSGLVILDGCRRVTTLKRGFESRAALFLVGVFLLAGLLGGCFSIWN